MRVFEHYIKLANPNLDFACTGELDDEVKYYEKLFADIENRLEKLESVFIDKRSKKEKVEKEKIAKLESFKKRVFNCIEYDYRKNIVIAIDTAKLVKTIRDEISNQG